MKKNKEEIRYYPAKVDFLRTQFSDQEKIQIVNSEDFPLSQMLSMIGLKRYEHILGITDAQEIKRRTEMFIFLRKHPEISSFLSKLNRDVSIPTNQQNFLNFFDVNRKHNPYWENIHQFVSFFEKYTDLPGFLSDFVSQLKDSLALEHEENSFGKKVSQEIQKSSVISGFLDFSLVLSAEPVVENDIETGKYYLNTDMLKIRETQITGYKAFSFALNDFISLRMPSWCYNRWAKFFGLKAIMTKRFHKINQERKARAYKAMLFDSFGEQSSAVASDFSNSLQKFFNKIIFDYIDNEEEISFSNDLQEKLVYGSLEVFGKLGFFFDKNGLRLQIMEFELRDRNGNLFPVRYGQESFFYRAVQEATTFEGFHDNERDFLLKGAQEMSSELLASITRANSAMLRLWLAQQENSVFEPFKAESTALVSCYQWLFLDNIYTSTAFKDVYKKLKDHREFFASANNQLRSYLSIDNEISSFAKRFNCPTVVPEILGKDSHVVQFQRLLPLNMLVKQHEKGILFSEEATQPILINNFPQINGNIIFLTGFHGGGKTTAGQSTLLMAYLALSGVPVFASQFKINPKTALGSIVSSEGSESTATVLLNKSNALVKKAVELPNNQVLFFIDEIGKGTQEMAGIELGLDLLETFKDKGISLVVNSQIMRLAELAKTHYGAICLKVDENHQFVAGIADGGMSELRKKTGINKYLKKSKVTL